MHRLQVTRLAANQHAVRCLFAAEQRLAAQVKGLQQEEQVFDSLWPVFNLVRPQQFIVSWVANWADD
jgi:hypothetical protein